MFGLAAVVGGGHHAAVSRAATGDPVVVSGVVSDGSGAPAAGATVLLYPNQLNGTAVAPVASAVTDQWGSYTLASAFVPSLQAVAQNDENYVSFDLEVQSPSLSYSTFFSRQWTGSAWVDGSALAGAASHVKLAAGAKDVRRTPRFMLAMLRHNAAQPNTVPANCFFEDDKQAGTSQQRLTVIGEEHTANDATEDYKYAKTSFASTNVEIGSSADGKVWSADGTVDITDQSSSTGGVHKTVFSDTGTKVGSEFEYAEFGHYAVCPSGKHFVSWLAESTGWNGGIDIGGSGYNNHDLDGHCPDPSTSDHTQPFGMGTGTNTKSEKQVTFSTAANLSIAGVGVGLDAQSGWSTNIESVWSFGSAVAHHYLCGNNGPYLTAPRIYAGLQQ